MGLFGRKKDACPVCGGEVKGLFNKKIADKQVLCKDCSEQVSMKHELLKTATPEFISEHLAYRQKNAIKYNALRWDMKFNANGTRMGVDPGAGFLYLRDDDLDDLDNPVVFSFNQITRYELYRLNKCVDSSDIPGEVTMESTLSALSGLSKLIDKDNNSNDYFRLVVIADDPYWPEIDLKIRFNSPDDLYGIGGFGDDLQKMCKVLKSAVRKEQVILF